MKTLALICSTCALMISGAAYAHDVMRIDPALIHLTGGDGLDSDAYAQGNDHDGGMWEGATGFSSNMQRPATIQAAPANRQWSRLNTREHAPRHTSEY